MLEARIGRQIRAHSGRVQNGAARSAWSYVGREWEGIFGGAGGAGVEEVWDGRGGGGRGGGAVGGEEVGEGGVAGGGWVESGKGGLGGGVEQGERRFGMGGGRGGERTRTARGTDRAAGRNAGSGARADRYRGG